MPPEALSSYEMGYWCNKLKADLNVIHSPVQVSMHGFAKEGVDVYVIHDWTHVLAKDC